MNRINYISVLSFFVFTLLTLWMCEQDPLTQEESQFDSEQAVLSRDVANECGQPKVTVNGTGESTGKAKNAMKAKAAITCYNLCKNQNCEEADESCAYDGFKAEDVEVKKNDDGTYTAIGEVTCDCACEDCKGKKYAGPRTFTGTAEIEESENQKEAEEKAEKAAQDMAQAMADEFCMKECERFQCEEPEICKNSEAKTKEISSEPDDEKIIWTVVLELKSCDCDCE